METKREFKVGDKVWSIQTGFGEVTDSLSRNSVIYVTSQIKYKNYAFELDGCINGIPVLFHADEIPEYYQQFIKDEQIGKWGYFWDEYDVKENFAHFGKLTGIKKVAIKKIFFNNNIEFDNFCLEIPAHCKD